MSIHTRHSSRPTESVLPRAQSGHTREYVHGPLQPMEDESARSSWTSAFCWFTGSFAAAIAIYHVARAIGVSTWWFAL